MLGRKSFVITPPDIAQILRERQQQTLEVIKIRSADPGDKVHDALQTSSQFVLNRFTRGHHFCKAGHLRDKLFDFTLAIERIAPPGSRKIAPLDEVEPRRAKAVERTSLLARPQRR